MLDKKTAAQIRNDLRRRWRWDKQRKEALKRAFHHKVAVRVGKKIRYIEYFTCEKCTAIVPRKEKQVDHIEPVVDPATGFTTWDNYIDRLYVEAGKLMILCLMCHSPKSIAENARRKRK